MVLEKGASALFFCAVMQADKTLYGDDFEVLLYQKLLEHGLTPCPPLGQTCPFDLLSVSRYTGKVNKIQMKTVSKPYHNDLYRVRFTKGCRSKDTYDRANVDFFVVLIVPYMKWLVLRHTEDLKKSLCVCGSTSLKTHPARNAWNLLHS